MSKKEKYIVVSENMTIEELANIMINVHKKGFIAKAVFDGIHLSTEYFKSAKEIVDYYRENHSIIKKIEEKINELEEESKKGNIEYHQIKRNIYDSIDYIDFNNPNEILEWFCTTFYYTNLFHMNKVVIKILRLLNQNHYLSFNEMVEKNISYNDETIPRYLIGQLISCLEEIGLIDDILIDFTNCYVEKQNQSKKVKFNKLYH